MTICSSQEQVRIQPTCTARCKRIAQWYLIKSHKFTSERRIARCREKSHLPTRVTRSDNSSFKYRMKVASIIDDAAATSSEIRLIAMQQLQALLVNYYGRLGEQIHIKPWLDTDTKVPTSWLSSKFLAKTRVEIMIYQLSSILLVRNFSTKRADLLELIQNEIKLNHNKIVLQIISNYCQSSRTIFTAFEIAHCVTGRRSTLE